MPKTIPKPKPRQSKKKLVKKKQSIYNWKYAAIFIALVIAIGGYVVYQSYASGGRPRNVVYLPSARTSNRQVQAAICQSGQNRIYLKFTKNGRDTYTDYAPELVFARKGVRTGQIRGYKTWTPLAQDPSAEQYLGNQTMGNRRSDDTVKVKYGGAQGAALYWRQIPYCRY